MGGSNIRRSNTSPLPTHPPKSRHSQTQPINIVKDLNRSTQVVRSGKSVTPSDVGTQASDTVEVEVETATDTVEDTLIRVVYNNFSKSLYSLFTYVVVNSDNSIFNCVSSCFYFHFYSIRSLGSNIRRSNAFPQHNYLG